MPSFRRSAVDARARLAVLALVLSSVATPLHAQRAQDPGRWTDRCRDDHWGDDSRAHYCEIRESGFKAGGALSVDPGGNGAIRIVGWDRDSVAVTAKVQAQAGTDEAARDLARRVRISAEGGAVRADGPSTGRRESWTVSFTVAVPRRSDVTAQTVNGPIRVADVTGKLELRAVNGPVSLDAVGGDVHARTTNGPLVVSLDGDRWRGAGLDAETENGPVTLTLPARYAARLETGTVNGPMNIDYPITLQGRISFRRITTDIGGGGPAVRVVTTNGPVTVRSQ
jgi:DUF4097 and DUF4098 domain-containing protein YvlB